MCAERLDALDHVEIGELVDGLDSLCNKISSNDDDGQFGVSHEEWENVSKDCVLLVRLLARERADFQRKN